MDLSGPFIQTSDGGGLRGRAALKIMERRADTIVLHRWPVALGTPAMAVPPTVATRDALHPRPQSQSDVQRAPPGNTANPAHAGRTRAGPVPGEFLQVRQAGKRIDSKAGTARLPLL